MTSILCVDDEPDIRTVLAMSLKFALDAEVSAVGSAREAFAFLESNPCPDLILLDGVLPEMDGVQVCRQLRADKRYRAIPVVFLSGRTTQSDLDAALEAGAIACISKPFDPMTIGEQISEIMRTRAQPLH